MGIGANAELIWGVPIRGTDDEGEPTQFWDEESEYWLDFEGDLEIVPYGHYEDSEDMAILTTKAIKRYLAWCDEGVRVPERDLDVQAYFSDEVEVFVAAVAEIDDSLPCKAGWWLCASLG